MGAPPGAPGMEPGMSPPGPPAEMMAPPASHVPGVDVQPGQVVFAQAPEGPTWPEGTIMTTYYYRAGRRHNQTPLAALCAEHKPVHTERANVLFSDGAVKSLPEGPWRALGFETPAEISARRAREQGPAASPPMTPMRGQSVPPGFY